MIWRPTHHKRIVQLADCTTVGASFVAAYFLWNRIRIATDIALPIPLSWNHAGIVGGLSLLWVALLAWNGAYSYQRFTSIEKEISRVAKTTIIGILTILAVHFIFRFGYIPRTYIIVFGIVNIVMLSLEKTVLYFVANIIRKKGKNRKKILIVGTGRRSRTFIEAVRKNAGWGLDIVGLLSGDPTASGVNWLGCDVIGRFEDIEFVLRNNQVDEVIICVSTKRFGEIQEIMECCEREGIQVRLYSEFFGKIAKRVRVDEIYGLTIISFGFSPDNEFLLYAKRAMDIMISGTLMLLFSPFFLIIAVIIKMSSPGPVLYNWNVVGLNKRPFKSWKFRTMVANADELKDNLSDRNEMKGPVFKIANDPRVTWIGRFLRKYSLDELPQLWSVLKGDMSLVGPRPAGTNEIGRYESWHRRKLSIKPGITCLWQVSGRNKIENFDEWVKLDLQYIDNWSIWMDIKILAHTVISVVRGTGV
jgi:exopolysaccharide biosynthesis polyprenyl glycosylphosphotransferase